MPKMYAIELNYENIDRITAVCEFVWPENTRIELEHTLEECKVLQETYFFVPFFEPRFASPHTCAHPVFIRGDVLEKDFDYTIDDRNKPFEITRKL